MSRFSRSRLRAVGTFMLGFCVLIGMVAGSAGSAFAGPPKHKTIAANKLQKVYPGVRHGRTAPLHPVRNAPKFVPIKTARQSPIRSTSAKAPTVTQTTDLKVLLLAADGTEADFPAIQQELNYLGVPYTTYIAAQYPSGNLTPGLLSSGSHGFYDGVILTTSSLGYQSSSGWQSALTQTEWQNLWTYEANFGVREVSWYTYPTADFGYGTLSGATGNPTNASYAAGAATIFTYANRANPVTIQYAYTYLAPALNDGLTTPILTDGGGNALAVVHTTATQNNRQTLSLTFDSNPYLTHTLVYGYGVVNWVTGGLFLGDRHVYFSPQSDDELIDDHTWPPSTACGTDPESTPTTYRITGSDYNALVRWQRNERALAPEAALRVTMAFNGEGATGEYSPDTLTPAIQGNSSPFYWVNHTFDHESLDSISYADAVSELSQNNAMAGTLGLANFSTQNLVTPDISGLGNPNAMRAAHDQGVHYLVSDTSIASENNPSPNAGIYNSSQPSILEIPRRPTNLFYNVGTPAQWAAEYNCLYFSYWGRNLSYSEILGVESSHLLPYLLLGDMDPDMYHQTNLEAYDGVHSLMGDLLNTTFQQYNALFTLPQVYSSMNQLGVTMANRMQYNASGATATYTPTSATTGTITIHVTNAATVPVTGLHISGSELYGGQYIAHIKLNAGQTVSFSVS